MYRLPQVSVPSVHLCVYVFYILNAHIHVDETLQKSNFDLTMIVSVEQEKEFKRKRTNERERERIYVQTLADLPTVPCDWKVYPGKLPIATTETKVQVKSLQAVAIMRGNAPCGVGCVGPG